MNLIVPALAAALLLAGCTSDAKIEEAFKLSAPEDDAHCQSLLMRPGELVYAQCRLALRKTYLNNFAERKAVIEEKYGSLPQSLDRALRNDAFCNYDESVKMLQQQSPEEVIAETAYDSCETTRTELASAFAAASGTPAETLIALERPMIISQNIEAVREARDVING
ncbi:hypothetical protein [Aurantimonas sp. VKM B-3413]|uniref:hypothetical protein n=1 Tax=Aurantimonas sp. VKM B-3413 TaxID=2779401 RepID=UPI001E65728F|nr:hypothetical protein [Aurantimonas sp. VKM B-3413]MCB8837771.1 hypothetical protein [Aurantimonas sp. VKM B-3413]